MLRLENTKDFPLYLQKAKTLYEAAFPPAEKMPFRLLLKKAQNSNASLFAVTDTGEFKGIAYTVWHKDIVFLFYLAVDEQSRGKGVGSDILRLIGEKFSNCRIVLNIEAPDENAPNNEERIRRKQFYLKNGFTEAGYQVKEYSVTYENLCISPRNRLVTKEEYAELIEAYLGKAMYFIYRQISK